MIWLFLAKCFLTAAVLCFLAALGMLVCVFRGDADEDWEARDR